MSRRHIDLEMERVRDIPTPKGMWITILKRREGYYGLIVAVKMSDWVIGPDLIQHAADHKKERGVEVILLAPYSSLEACETVASNLLLSDESIWPTKPLGPQSHRFNPRGLRRHRR